MELENENEMLEDSAIRSGVIYKYTSPSGKIYIGQTVNEKRRKSQHKYDSAKSNTYFGRAIQKYGWDSFKYEVIIKFKPTVYIEKLSRVLNKLETRYIKLYQSNNSEIGYNLTEGGDGFIGLIFTDEHKQNLSIAAKARKEIEMQDEEMRAKIMKNLAMGQNGSYPASEETKKKMSKAQDYKKKKVCKYNLHRELIGEFNSIADAARSIDSTNTFKTINNRISECCSGKRTTTYEHMWMFSED